MGMILVGMDSDDKVEERIRWCGSIRMCMVRVVRCLIYVVSLALTLQIPLRPFFRKTQSILI